MQVTSFFVALNYKKRMWLMYSATFRYQYVMSDYFPLLAAIPLLRNFTKLSTERS